MAKKYGPRNEKMVLASPPSGGDKHSPADGCGWGVFVVR